MKDWKCTFTVYKKDKGVELVQNEANWFLEKVKYDIIKKSILDGKLIGKVKENYLEI
jgi:hypothetical protein